MDRDDTSTPTVAPPESPEKPSRPRRNRRFRQFAIVIAAVIPAIAALVTAMSNVDPNVLSQALTIFRGWPLPVRILAVIAVLPVIAALAFLLRMRQTAADIEQQGNISTGAGLAIEGTIAPDIQGIRDILGEGVPAIQKSLDAFLNLLAFVFVGSSTRSRPIEPEASRHSALLPRVPEPIPADAGPRDDVQLMPPGKLIGRDSELHWLEERLTSHHPEQDTTVIFGRQGIGKAALASTAITRIKQRNAQTAQSSNSALDAPANDPKASGYFTGGIAYVRCSGLHDAVEVVRLSLGRADPNHRLPATRDPQILRQLSEELLAEKDILIVLYGVEPDVPLDEIIRALRTEKRSAHILITTTALPPINVTPADSHRRLHALGQVHHDDGTVTDEALELFAYYAGKESAKDFGEHLGVATAIVETLERHTYALQLVGARVRVQPEMLEHLAADIERLNEGIVSGEVEGMLKEVWVAAQNSVDSLPGDARQLLVALGAFGTPEAGYDATRAVGEALGLQEVNDNIYTLVQRQLVESFYTPGMPDGSDCYRLRIHIPLYAYIANRVTRPEWSDLYTRSKDAIVAHFARYVQHYDRRDPSRTSQRALTPDANNIVQALNWAISHNQHEQVTAIVHCMRYFWHDRWLTQKSLFYMPTAVLSAQLLASQARDAKDIAREMTFLERAADIAFMLGRVYRRIGEFADAEPLFQQDLKFRRQQQQYALQAEALHQLAQLERSRGCMKPALNYCYKGLSVVRRRTPRRRNSSAQQIIEFAQAKGFLLAQQGRIERSRGNLRQADKLFEQALAIFERTGDVHEQGVALGYRGRIARVLGNLSEAEQFFVRSGQLARQVNDIRGEGSISTQLGRIDRMRGHLDRAEERFNDGLNKARQVLDHQAVSINLNHLGRVAVARGDIVTAEGYFTSALEQAKRINDCQYEGVALGYLGRIARDRVYLTEARSNFRDSLRILRDVEDRRGQALILAEVALLDSKSRHFVRARWRICRSLRLIGKVGDKRNEGVIMRYLGQIHIARKDLAAARVQLNKALDSARLAQDRTGEAEVHLWLGKAAEMSGDITLAKQCYDACRGMVAQGGNKRLWEDANRRYNALDTSAASRHAGDGAHSA